MQTPFWRKSPIGFEIRSYEVKYLQTGLFWWHDIGRYAASVLQNRIRHSEVVDYSLFVMCSKILYKVYTGPGRYFHSYHGWETEF